MRGAIDFDGVNRAVLAVLPALLARWAPGGTVRGSEYVARNPTRADRRPGSFSVNLRTGRWADFACGAKGGDVVSLAAYLSGIGQVEAVRKLSTMLGVRRG
jgi:DNA primase